MRMSSGCIIPDNSAQRLQGMLDGHTILPFHLASARISVSQ
ncbi:hypothetical protein SAMN04490209_5622 [Pseudomonas rhodesiae]|uniref:Uncharacterized protein n=1 Tax=Pseudomonas rhodesiae TaxID=76760 RepID=A0AAE8HI67_9PSED|nr:hypothetical protein SAMN04490209_5622 [Pseudomonas rhodesiae]